MTLADQIRQHLADHGADTNKGMSIALNACVDQVSNATRNLMDKGDVICELMEREGSLRPVRAFSLCGGMTRDASPQMMAALNDLQRAWG